MRIKAIVYKKYGPPEVLQLQEIPKPGPRANEVLVKVHATTVTIGDCRMRSFTVPRRDWLFARLYLGVFKPRRPILGMELAGEIEAVGKNVTRFQHGDPVFAFTFEGYHGWHCQPRERKNEYEPKDRKSGWVALSYVHRISCLRRCNWSF